MLYRIHQRLLVDSANGVFVEGGRGCVHTLSMLGKDKIVILLKVGAISLVQAPPLSTFSAWAGRAAKLDELGIDTVGFVTMDAKDIAYALRALVRKEETDDEAFNERVEKLTPAVARWQLEIRKHLGISGAKMHR